MSTTGPTRIALVTAVTVAEAPGASRPRLHVYGPAGALGGGQGDQPRPVRAGSSSLSPLTSCRSATWTVGHRHRPGQPPADGDRRRFDRLRHREVELRWRTGRRGRHGRRAGGGPEAAGAAGAGGSRRRRRRRARRRALPRIGERADDRVTAADLAVRLRPRHRDLRPSRSACTRPPSRSRPGSSRLRPSR